MEVVEGVAGERRKKRQSDAHRRLAFSRFCFQRKTNTAPGYPKIRAPVFAPEPAPVGVAVAPRPSAVVVGGSAVEAGDDGLGQDFSTSDDPARDDTSRGRDLLFFALSELFKSRQNGHSSHCLRRNTQRTINWRENERKRGRGRGRKEYAKRVVLERVTSARRQKTHLDLDTVALDGNPARKIRGLQFSSRGHRSARRGARSDLDGEGKLDVRNREALLVGC